MKVKIEHSGFHGHTTCNLNVPGTPGEQIELTRHQINRLITIPCGISDCRCGETMIAACDKVIEGAKGISRAWITLPELGETIELGGFYA